MVFSIGAFRGRHSGRRLGVVAAARVVGARVVGARVGEWAPG